MFKLNQNEYGRATALFEPVRRNLAVWATLAGNNPGQIWVDDTQHPRVALALTPEGVFLAGEPTFGPGRDALRQFLRAVVWAGQAPYIDEEVCLIVHPAGWKAFLPEIIPSHIMIPSVTYHYLCDISQHGEESRFDWQQHLPEGYTIRQIDRAFFDDPAITMSDDLSDWYATVESWGTLDHFLAHGAGFCVMYGNTVAARCQADCFADDQIELGIITGPAHRRRGLATIAAAATVDHCFERGYRRIGWHCVDPNIGSWKTAEKVGFQRAETYMSYPYLLNPVDHLADRGWYCYQHGDYSRTAAFYVQVFAQRADNPPYYYHLAALASAQLGEADQAIAYLDQAVDYGWCDVEATRHHDAFSLLHDHPAWSGVLARMAEQAN